MRKITGKSLEEIARGLNSGTPVAEYALFNNDHEDVSARLRSFLAELPSIGTTLKFFESVAGQNTEDRPTKATEITPEILSNILNAHEEGLRRQQQLWDEYGHR
jgi:hypothetical protein